MAALPLLASCGPGQLPGNKFGTAADEIGETNATSGSEAESTDADSDSDSTVSSVADEGPTSGPDDASDDAPTSTSDDAPTSSDDGSTSTSDGEGTGSTADESSSSSDGDGGSTDEDGGFGIPPDVTNEPCNPLAQDCYPTHKCVPYATVEGSPFLDADKCMPILGDKGWGEPCTLSNFNEAQDDCDGEGFCWNLEWIDGELQGTCVPFCTGSPQNLMCPPGWGCLFSGAVALCSKQCNPLLQDCPNQYACYWIVNAFQCALTGTLGQDVDPCEQANDCTPGLGCVAKAEVPGCPGSANTCCTPFCNLDAPDCPPGRECTAFFVPGEEPPGYENVGMCLKP